MTTRTLTLLGMKTGDGSVSMSCCSSMDSVRLVIRQGIAPSVLKDGRDRSRKLQDLGSGENANWIGDRSVPN